MQLEDMEVRTQSLDSQPFLAILEGIFTTKVGSEAPFLPISSPLELNKWLQALPVETNAQGGVGSSREGTSGLRPPTQVLLPK